MNYNNNLANDIWFNQPNKDVDYMRCLFEATSNAERALAICDGLKVGDFSLKKELISLLNSNVEPNVLNLCVRLFASVATHEDFQNVDNLRFLSTAKLESLETFVTTSTDAMTLQVIPFLISLLNDDRCNETLKVSIYDALDCYLNLYDTLGDECNISMVEDFCASEIKTIDPTKYYYERELAFPGNLVKKLIQRAIISLRNRESLKSHVIPSLLSIWSGKRCPVDYNTIITDEKYNNLMRWVDELSHMKWERGKKYFYGIEV